MPNSITAFVSIVSVIGAGVTAFATLLLWRVTKTLAIETKRMADASAQPQVVATIEPNQWSTMHADLHVENTGNAAAYEIDLKFDPPLENGDGRSDLELPLQHLSVLKPGQGMASYLSEFPPLIDKKFTVTVSWKRKPSDTLREGHTYVLDLSALKGVSHLGTSNPLVQVAEQIKKIREDWQYVANGNRKVKAEVFTAADRLQERQDMERRMQRQANPAPTAQVVLDTPEEAPKKARPRKKPA